MFSNCTVHKSIPRSILAEYEPIIFPYLKTIGYKGLFGIEFKWDHDDEQFKLMDINARSCGDSALGPACGLDDNITAYHDALGHDVHPKNSYQTDLYYIWDPEDLYSLCWLVALGGKERTPPEGKTDWPLPIFQHLTGKLPEAELMKRAGAAENEKKTGERLCELHGYLGIAAEREGNTKKARTHYQAAIDTKVDTFIEYRMAKFRLQALDR